jgi:hypothetical protein
MKVVLFFCELSISIHNPQVRMIKSKLIEADEEHLFYCNNCKNEFKTIYTFQPVPGLQEFYHCTKCGGIMPIKDLKKARKSIICCLCCFLPSF